MNWTSSIFASSNSSSFITTNLWMSYTFRSQVIQSSQQPLGRETGCASAPQGLLGWLLPRAALLSHRQGPTGGTEGRWVSGSLKACRNLKAKLWKMFNMSHVQDNWEFMMFRLYRWLLSNMFRPAEFTGTKKMLWIIDDLKFWNLRHSRHKTRIPRYSGT